MNFRTAFDCLPDWLDQSRKHGRDDYERQGCAVAPMSESNNSEAEAAAEKDEDHGLGPLLCLVANLARSSEPLRALELELPQAALRNLLAPLAHGAGSDPQQIGERLSVAGEADGFLGFHEPKFSTLKPWVQAC